MCVYIYIYIYIYTHNCTQRSQTQTDFFFLTLSETWLSSSSSRTPSASKTAHKGVLASFPFSDIPTASETSLAQVWCDEAEDLASRGKHRRK